MSTSKRTVVILALSVLFVDATASPAVDDNPTTLHLTQRLVRAAFPELHQMELSVSLRLESTGVDRDWDRIAILDFVIYKSGEAPSMLSSSKDERNPLLSASVVMNVAGQYVEHASFSGTHVHFEQESELYNLVRDHPDWTDADLATAMAERGAKFGPQQRREFVRQLHLERFAAVVGKVDKVETFFNWKLGLRPAEPQDMTFPGWIVKLRARQPKGLTMCYLLSFEPFEGRVRMLSGRPCSVPPVSR